MALAYSAVFQFPLTQEEVFARQVKVGFRPLTHSQLRSVMQALRAKHLIVQSSHYYTLAHFRAQLKQWIRRREQALIQSQKQEKELEPVVALARRLPWVSAIALTGSLAVKSVSSNSDSDFMIVTQPRRLWVTRLIFTLFALLRGRRRAWHGKQEQRWCFNLWLDINHLALPQEHHTLYGAYESIQARWIFDREGVSERFFAQNPWIGKWVTTPKEKPQSSKTAAVRRSVGERVLDGIEQVTWWFQHWYMRPHMTREVVSQAAAFFHPRPTGQLICSALHRLLTQADLLPASVWHLPHEVKTVLHHARVRHQRLVLATGMFDGLHQEHRAFLRAARQAGDLLLVGVESDLRTRHLKGAGRPVHSQDERIRNLRATNLAAAVFVLPEQFWQEADYDTLISMLKPSLLAVSAHTEHLSVKRKILARHGGKVEIVHAHNPAISTTKLLKTNRVGPIQ